MAKIIMMIVVPFEDSGKTNFRREIRLLRYAKVFVFKNILLGEFYSFVRTQTKR